jgi:hypothetical protein
MQTFYPEETSQLDTRFILGNMDLSSSLRIRRTRASPTTIILSASLATYQTFSNIYAATVLACQISQCLSGSERP